MAYDYLSRGYKVRLEEAQRKYVLFVNKYGYGKYFLDDLSIACYWTGRYEEGLNYLKQIQNDPEFAYHSQRLNDNEQHFMNAMKQTTKVEVNFGTNNDIFATTI